MQPLPNYHDVIMVLSCTSQGRVSFDSNGTREQGDVTLLQYRDSTGSSDSTIERVRIGQVNRGVYVYYENESNDTVFPGELTYMCLCAEGSWLCQYLVLQVGFPPMALHCKLL